MKYMSVVTIRFDDFSSKLNGIGFKSHERSLIISRSLMWGYIIKVLCNETLHYRIVDIDKYVRTRSLHRGIHGKNKSYKMG